MHVAAANRPSLAKTFSIVAILSVVSKVVGLLRDIVIASAYGTEFLADAYNYAYLFTGNILVLFGGLGGPFHSATVTTLTPRKSEPGAGTLVTQIAIRTAIFLGVATLLVVVLAPYMVDLVAGNYHGPDRQAFFAETVRQLRLMSPLVLLSGLIGISYGVLNVYDLVFWPSLSPAIASLAIIFALKVFPDPHSSIPLAAGTLVGAFGQLFAQMPGIFQLDLKFKFQSQPESGLHDFTKVLWPALFGTSIGQLIIYVDSFFCSGIGEGAWTAIANANRLVQLPLGVLITAMLVPALPRFTEYASANKSEEVKAEFRRALSFLTFIAAPITVVFLSIPSQIVRLLFERGHWTPESTELVSSALIYLVPSIVFYIGRDLITRVFYAYQDSKTPYYVAMLAIVIKVALDYLFVVILQLGVGGISMATSLITVFNLTLLSILLRRKIGPLGLTKLFKPYALITISCVLSGVAIYYCQHWLETVLPSSGLLNLLLEIALDTAIGGAIYFAFCMLFKLQEAHTLIQRLAKRR
jgi:putative peptidoglycan lipid II flippase